MGERAAAPKDLGERDPVEARAHENANAADIELDRAGPPGSHLGRRDHTDEPRLTSTEPRLPPPERARREPAPRRELGRGLAAGAPRRNPLRPRLRICHERDDAAGRSGRQNGGRASDTINAIAPRLSGERPAP